MRTRLAVLALTLVSIQGCRRAVSGDDWLFLVHGDTVTVEDAGLYWEILDPEVQMGFMSGTNPVGDFVLAYTRRILVEHEMGRLDILALPSIAYRTEAWNRLQASRSVDAAIREASLQGVSDEEIEFYLDHLGSTVWYSTRYPGSAVTTSQTAVLSEMPPAIGGILAQLSPGQSAECPDGRILTLDSILGTDPALVTAMLEDSASTISFGRNRIAQQRAAATLDSLRAVSIAEASPVFYEQAFSAFAEMVAGGVSPSSTDTLFTSSAGVWTAARMVQQIRVARLQGPVRPSDTTWRRAFSEVLIPRRALAGRLEALDPEAFSALAAETEGYRMRLAADTLYRTFVPDSLEVTAAMLDSAYAASAPMLPERRSVLCVVLRDTSEVEAFRRSMTADGARGFLSEGSYAPFPPLAASPDDPALTRPLLVEEVPAGLGEAVFSTEDETRWFGPVPYAPMEAWIAVRLDSIHPARQATPEEASLQIEGEIRAARSQILFEEWMRSIEVRYGLDINEDVLDRLPADPSEWSGL
jgi:hypothetical protein